MIHFINQSSATIYPILVLGSILLVREIILLFKAKGKSGYSPHSIRSETNFIFVGSMALVVLGTAGSALGLYITTRVITVHKLSEDIFVNGLKDALSPLLVSSLLASSVLLIHFVNRKFVIHWQSPVPKLARR